MPPLPRLQTLSTAFDPLVTKLQGWGETLMAMLPNMVVAVVVMIAAGLLATLASRSVRRLAERSSDNVQLARLASISARFAVLLLGLFLALSVLQLDKTVTSLLAGAGVAGIALGFAVQGVAASVVSGLVISTRRPYKIGDLVRLGDHLGHVEGVDFRTTRLTLLTGETAILPNHTIIEGAILNISAARVRRIAVEVGVSYDTPLDLAETAAREAIESLDWRAEGEPVDILFTGFGGSSIDMVCRFRISSTGQVDVLSAKSEAIKAIKARFDEEEIDIPFPIRTLELGASAEQLHTTLREVS